MKVITYTRCSTQEQSHSGLGLAAQAATLGTSGKQHGWTVVATFEDAGYSASNMRRPGLSEALDVLAAGGADALAVSRVDRLSRSLADYAAMAATAQRQGWSLICLDSPVDPSSPAGEAMLGIMVVFSQMERRIIGARTREALAAKKARGERVGRERMIAPEVEQRAKALRASGLTQRAVGEALAAEGLHGPSGHGWAPATLHKMLTRAAA